MSNIPIRWGGDFRILHGTRLAEVDELNYLVTIEEIHHLVHEGKVYTASDVQSSSAAIYWAIINPGNTTKFHKRNWFSTDASGEFNIYHNALFGTFAKGTQFYGYNNNQLVGGTTILQFWAVPLGLTGTGDRRYHARVGAGGAQRIGGDIIEGAENIVKNNGTYLFEFVPDAAAKTSLSIGVYEV